MSWSDFLSNYRVESGRTLIPLKKYAKTHEIPVEDLRVLFNHIENREEYLGRFYDTSLKPLLPLSIRESPMLMGNINNNAEVKYKNVIRNMYYKDILKNTKSGIDNVKSFLTVLDDLYNHRVIDYKILTPSARFYAKNGRIGSVFSSFYFRASILNPYVIYSLNHRLLKGTRIFTPTLGWSSYCYGFMECPHVIEYVGNDIIPSVCKKTEKFARTFYPEKASTIWCEPSENLLTHPAFMLKYKNYFDVVFFSPPYYRLELYPGKKQSTERYQTYEEWLQGYWEKTIQMCWHVLEPGGRLCYIISNYQESERPNINLVQDMVEITKKHGFAKKGAIRPMWNKTVAVNVDTGDNHENICLFVKKSTK
jgi:hypothetical protein